MGHNNENPFILKVGIIVAALLITASMAFLFSMLFENRLIGAVLGLCVAAPLCTAFGYALFCGKPDDME